MPNSFPRAKFEENVSFEKQVMSKERYMSIFSHEMEVLAFITLQMFLQLVRGKKTLPKSSPFPARDVHFSVFSSTTFYVKKERFFFCNNRNTLSHLELNLKRKLPPGLEL